MVKSEPQGATPLLDDFWWAEEAPQTFDLGERFLSPSRRLQSQHGWFEDGTERTALIFLEAMGCHFCFATLCLVAAVSG